MLKRQISVSDFYGLNSIMQHFVTLLSLLFLNCTTVYSDTNFKLSTKLGDIKGVQSVLTINNTSYHYKIFKNIPYAKPPTGQYRFRRPVPYGQWKGTFDATQFGPSCIQTNNAFVDKWLPNLNQSEDCLLLNIYCPTNSSTANKKSVMIWIHGGGYQTGQGMLYNASYISAVGDVIVVTINYRLEAFGFFSTNDDIAPGNYGLWDQKMAIEWVNNNIESFGGDTKSITLFGQSAGGLSAGLQAFNVKNKGLFQRVILQSGVGNSIFSTKPFPRAYAKELARLVNCSSNLTIDTMKCLRTKSAKDIHEACEMISNKTHQLEKVHIGIPFAPVVDNNFLVDKPQNILENPGPVLDFYRSLDILMGNSDSEGSSLILILEGRKDINVTTGVPFNYLCDHIIPTLSIDYYNNISSMTPLICNEYRSNGSLLQQSRNSVNFYGDVFFYSPSVSNLNIHSSNRDSHHFFYLNTRQSVDNSLGTPWFNGTAHGDELFYLFPDLISNPSKDDKSFSMTLMKYWSNFAKTGDVNGPGLPHWPQYDVHDKQYAELDVNVKIKSNLFKSRVDFWLNDIKPLLRMQKLDNNGGQPCCQISFVMIVLVFIYLR
ncbi:carboxylesterase 5A-like [Mytilus galloprovincialis]|uniref:carboxylesterase 5A-like n=1 Tax=Mytilus galloprovincialis TaxID=29158 RepID=UPI003F7C5952